MNLPAFKFHCLSGKEQDIYSVWVNGNWRKTLSEFINEKSSLIPEMAIRIASATNTTPKSWINMQSKLDLWHAENKKIKVMPFSELENARLELQN